MTAYEDERYEVSLDPDAYTTAKDLAEERGTSISQLLRTAITTQRWFDNVRAEGGRILVHRRGPLGGPPSLMSSQTILAPLRAGLCKILQALPQLRARQAWDAALDRLLQRGAAA